MNHNRKKYGAVKQDGSRDVLPGKEHFVIYAVDYDSIDDTKSAFTTIRLQDTALNYPFGYGKIILHGPEILVGGKFRVYASVKLYVDKYIRKCAYSEHEQIRSICSAWIKANRPELVDYLKNVFNQAWQIKDGIRSRNQLKGKHE